MLEENLELKVREEEVDLVKGMLEECQEMYSNIMMEETKREYTTVLTVMENSFLTKDTNGLCGGVVLYAHNRKIVCPNTLEDRLNLVFEMELPTLRTGLFPK